MSEALRRQTAEARSRHLIEHADRTVEKLDAGQAHYLAWEMIAYWQHVARFTAHTLTAEETDA